jgi:AcrR family transcriptional regulator
MGVKERREKEKEALRNAILDAANEIFIQDGYKDTTIRKIAKRIEYNPATIYFYYKNKEEVFMALQERAFNAFHQSIFEATQNVADPKDRITKMGRAYINFALKNPSLYDLMFILKQPMNAMEEGEKWHKGELSYDTLKVTVQACMDAGYLKKGDLDAMSYMIWSAMHGMVSLPICKRMKMFDETDLDFLIRDTYQQFNTMLFSMQP